MYTLNVHKCYMSNTFQLKILKVTLYSIYLKILFYAGEMLWVSFCNIIEYPKIWG